MELSRRGELADFSFLVGGFAEMFQAGFRIAKRPMMPRLGHQASGLLDLGLKIENYSSSAYAKHRTQQAIT
jgi:hypothetical protein